MADVGVKFKVDGESSFKSAIKSIDSQIKSLSAEMKANIAEMEASGNAEGALQAKMEGLNKIAGAQTEKLSSLKKEYDDQKAKLDRMREAVDEAAKAHGEGSKEAIKARDAYNRQASVVADLETKMSGARSEIAKINTTMKSGGEKTEDLSGKMETLGKVAMVKLAQESLGKLDAALTAIGKKLADAGKALFDLAKDSGAWADGLITTSVQTGISTETLQEWTYAARFVDTEVDTIAKSMQKLTRNMTSNSKETKSAFTQLGVSVRDSSGNLRDSQTVFWEAIEALGRVEDETTRNSLSMQIFGKSAMELNPLIVAGAETWNAYCQEAHTAGAVLSEDGVASLGAFDDAMQKNDATLQGLQRQIMASLIPAFTVIAEKVNEVARKFAEWASSNEGKEAIGKIAETVSNLVQSLSGKLGPAVQGVINLFSRAGAVINFLSANWKTIETVIITVAAAIAALKVVMIAFNIAMIATNPFAAIGAIIAILIPVIIGVVKLISDNSEQIKAFFASVAAFFAQKWEQLKASAMAIWNAIVTTFTNAKTAIETAFSTIGTFFAGVWTAISTAFNEVITFFSNLFTSAYTAVTGAFNSIGEFFNNLWTTIKNVFSTALGDFASIGLNMLQGIWNGISNATQWLWDKLSGWCGSVVDKVKNFFGIHSPSRVMRDQVGMMLGRGVAEGVEQSAGLVQRAYNSLMPKAQTITANVNAARGVAGSYGGQSDLASMIAAALNGVTVQMDGESVGRLVAPSVNEIMGRNARAARFA